MNNFKKMAALVLLLVLATQNFVVSVASAAVSEQVVINEIAWAGSSDAAGDEWIELYNAGGSAVDLSGWYIEDDVTGKYTIESGVVPAYGYFLIEDSEDSTSMAGAAEIGLSLANSGDSLVLKNAAGETVDSVNSTGGAWPAGSNGDFSTMERVDPAGSGDALTNWANAKSGNGAKASAGAAILGTPGSMNSNYNGAGVGINLSNSEFANNGETFEVAVAAKDASDLYAYGFEINYDKRVVNFVSASEGDFLKNGGASTAFNAGLEGSAEGKLLVGNARLLNPASGVDGSGTLFKAVFKVVGASEASTAISFGGSSFVSDSKGDVPAKFGSSKVTVGKPSVAGVANAKAAEGTDRYSIALSWDKIDGASYVIKRQASDLSFETLATVSENSFVDKTKLIPNLEYTYQVIAVIGGVAGDAAVVKGKDTRGLKGDLDRSDRVDGRDIEQLARSFGSKAGEDGYDALKDTTFDGIIDGSDLIDIGANFAAVY